MQRESVRNAGLTMYESLALGTQKSVRCPYILTGVLIKRVHFEKPYELFVGINETVCNGRVSVLSGCPY